LFPVVDISAAMGSKGKSITRDELGDAMTRTTALSSALADKLDVAGDTMTGLLQFSGTGHAGLHLNNLTTTQRDAISSPQAGMALWNTTTTRMNVHNGTSWTNGFVRADGDTMNLAANTGALTVNGTVTGGGVTRTLLALSDNWTGATGGTSAPRLLDLDITDTGGSLNFGSTLLIRARRNTANVFTMDHGGTCNWANGGAFVDTNNGKIQVASNWFFSLAGDVNLYRRAAGFLGFGVASGSPGTYSVAGQDGTGTNIAAGKLCLGPGRSTGSATPAVLALQGTAAGSSGSTAQTLVDALTVVNSTLVRLESGVALRLGNAAASGTVTPTHTLTVQDSTGTTYRIPCLI
jgi:hypothetical protein